MWGVYSLLRDTVYIYTHIHTAGKISIEHVTIFLSKYISEGAVDLKFSPDLGNNQSNPYKENKTNRFGN